MQSGWEWLDDSKTIVLVSVREGWSQNDITAYASDFWPQIAAQPHTVNVIVDLRQNRFTPMQPIITLIWLAKNRPKNAGHVVFVVRRVLGLAILRALKSTLHRLYPQFHISGVLTYEEAVRMLTVVHADETVEVPASSQAEVGSQSPSESLR